ncbi:MAG: hypothetical protein HQ580_17425 [Planctomycetes bacterium]|nr:hypothetical protein [Planctomycetota bacterium]
MTLLFILGKIVSANISNTRDIKGTDGITGAGGFVNARNSPGFILD